MGLPCHHVRQLVGQDITSRGPLQCCVVREKTTHPVPIYRNLGPGHPGHLRGRESGGAGRFRRTPHRADSESRLNTAIVPCTPAPRQFSGVPPQTDPDSREDTRGHWCARSQQHRRIVAIAQVDVDNHPLPDPVYARRRRPGLAKTQPAGCHQNQRSQFPSHFALPPRLERLRASLRIRPCYENALPVNYR